MTKPMRSAMLYETLRGDILQGRVSPERQLPTQTQMAEQYGVGVTTVSLAMTRLVGEGLVVRQRGKGSFVSKRMSTKTKMIDYLRARRQQGHTDDEHTSAVAYIKKTSAAFSRRGWKLRWHHLSDQEAVDIDGLADRLTGAHAVICEMDMADDLLRVLQLRDVAAVALYTVPPTDSMSPDAGKAHITIDRHASSLLATEHLIALGYRRIAYFGWPSTAQSDLRMKGFLQAMRQHELPLSAGWLIEAPADDENAWVSTMRDALRHPDRPEAICCLSGAMAYHAQIAALAEGLDVPRDLAIMACDGFDRAVKPPVPISEVSASLDDLCDQAVGLLERLQNGANHTNDADCGPILLPLHLTVRDSCGAKMKGLDPTDG